MLKAPFKPTLLTELVAANVVSLTVSKTALPTPSALSLLTKTSPSLMVRVPL